MNTRVPDRSVPPAPSSVPLLLAGASLLVLALASFLLSYVALGAFALPIALVIAALKIAIVLSVFMDFWRQSASVKFAALTALFMLFLLAALMAADGKTRSAPPQKPEFTRVAPPSSRAPSCRALPPRAAGRGACWPRAAS